MTIQPHHIATIAPTPETATARRNHGRRAGCRAARHQTNASQAPSASSAGADPDHRVEGEVEQGVGGRSLVGGMSSSPVTTVSVLKPTSQRVEAGDADRPT